MLPFFTDPYEDEILYSAAARYHHYSGNKNNKNTLSDMFCSAAVIPTIEFPCGLEYLSKQFLKGSVYTWEYLLSYHTMFPFYAPFLPFERAKNIKMEMRYGSSQSLYTKVGYVAGSICRNEWSLRYCPKCVVQDIQQYYDPYFHRIHQLQGIIICPEHRCYLKQYPITRRISSRIEFIRLDVEKLDISEGYIGDKGLEERFHQIANQAIYLNKFFHVLNQKKVHDTYIKLLHDRGLITVKGYIKQKELYEEFRNFYGDRLLEMLESNVDPYQEYNWLKLITRKPRTVIHPIRNILFIIYLCGNVENFVSEINRGKSSPFGESPWPCLNPSANHYTEPVVYKCDITTDYKTRKPVGTFICSCGFVYSRKGPDVALNDKYKIGRIKDYGHVWKGKLKQLILKNEYSLRALARCMSCDPKTIVRYAYELGLQHLVNTNVVLEYKTTNNKKETLEENNRDNQYKKQIIEFIKQNPESTRQQVRDNLRKQYIFLYRNDKNWLMKHLPEPIPRGKRSQKCDKRVNWEQRDLQIVEELKNAHRIILNCDKPIRLSKSALGKHIGRLSLLNKSLDFLPVTQAFLDNNLETVEDFQIRRIHKICNKLQIRGETIERWKVIRMGGLRAGYSEKVDSVINEYLL